MIPLFEKRPYSQVLFERIKQNYRVSSTFPLTKLINGKFAKAKNGSLSAVIALTGVDYTGQKSEVVAQLARYRKQAFELKTNRVDVTIFSRKRELPRENAIILPKEPVLRELVNKWEGQFKTSFKTTHFIVLTAKPMNTLDKVSSRIEASLNKSTSQILQESIDELLGALDSFAAHLLEGEAVSSFFATLLNGRETYVNATNWDVTLSNQALEFDRKQAYMIYGKNKESVYSGFLSIRAYPDQLTEAVLNDIYHFNLDFSVVQSFSPMSEELALKEMEKEEKRMKAADEFSELEELQQLKESILTGRTALVSHTFSVEVFSKNPDELEKSINLIKSKIERHGLLCFRETTNIEPLFWSRFPTLHYLNTRSTDITSENAADLVTFAQVGEGFESNGFGARPITHFKTNYNSLFAFNLHNSPAFDDTLGHTLLIGGSESGKTVLLSFLIANCLDYPNFRALLFDRLHGLEAFTRVFDGDYLDFSTDVELNPFAVDDTAANRSFLASWLKGLCQLDAKNPAHMELSNQIDDGVRRCFNIDQSMRTFESCRLNFGKTNGEVDSRLKQWQKDGLNGRFFNGKRDSFDFSKRVLTFDATTILSMPDVLSPVTDYLFHQHTMDVSTKFTPHVVAFDESPRYFQDPIFAKKMVESIKEIRKQRGVVILAAQDAASYNNLGKIGEEVIASLANYIIFPNPNGKAEDYIDFLGLNDTEFDWIKTNNPKGRKVLFKRISTGESVILDVNLSALNDGRYKFLNAFDSGTKAQMTLKSIMQSNPLGWKEQYLTTKLQK
ncbi:hypothetical protein O1D07_003366 [Vibrio cholerae]|nr:hypothetical protein [Vibrio cholerae]